MARYSIIEHVNAWVFGVKTTHCTERNKVPLDSTMKGNMHIFAGYVSFFRYTGTRSNHIFPTCSYCTLFILKREFLFYLFHFHFTLHLSFFPFNFQSKSPMFLGLPCPFIILNCISFIYFF